MTNTSVFGGCYIPILKKETLVSNNYNKENDNIFYKNNEPTGLTLFLRFIIIGGPIFVMCFLMYQCHNTVQSNHIMKYRQAAEQNNIPLTEEVLQNRPPILATYKIYSDRTGEIEIKAKSHYFKVLSDGKLYVAFFSGDESGRNPTAIYTGVESLVKTKDGYP